MGNFFTTEKERIEQMSPQARTDYMRCNSTRIASRQYYKDHPHEWYAEYEY